MDSVGDYQRWLLRLGLDAEHNLFLVISGGMGCFERIQPDQAIYALDTSFSRSRLGTCTLGAWVAVTGRIEWQPVPLGIAVLLWVAGFDIIYALQDEEVDRRLGICSLVAGMGAEKALLISRLFHLSSFLILLGFGYLLELGWFYFSGALVAGAALLIEQSLVSAEDRSRIGAAFFTANGFVSLTLLAATCLDVLLR